MYCFFFILHTSMEKYMNIFSLVLLVAFFLLCFEDDAMAALRCGNCGRTPVPYPLSTGPTCGDQDYKVQCKGGTLWLDGLNGSSFVITSISPWNQRLIIQPSMFLPNTCISNDLNNLGLHLNPNLPFNITGSNTILLLNCSDSVPQIAQPINCTSTSVARAYVDYTASAAGCRHAGLSCDFRTGGSQNAYLVRLHDGGCTAFQSFVNLDYKLPVAKWPGPGLEIEWVLPQEPVCRLPVDCRDMPKSKCLPDPANVGQRRCFCHRGFIWDPIAGACRKCHGKHCKPKKSQMPAMGGAIGVVILIFLSGFLIYRRQRHVKKVARKIVIKERENILNANNSGKSAKIFTGKDIKRATNNFAKDNLLGTGGFGEVFKGTLDDGTVIAVKRAKPGNIKGTAQVLNEVRILCQVNHRSLVRLIGCCVELEQPLLIYEYVSNGTLFEHLHISRFRDEAPLSWLHRLAIALQTAEGLAYLHSSAVPPIYHRDVKSSNILLDENLEAKVSDFGLSRLVQQSESDYSHINTSAQGTLGYLDPEYYLNLQLTDRSDVYSFGVVLLELLTTERAIDFNREEESVNLVVHMKKIMEQERFMDVVEPLLKEGATKVELESIKALGNLAAACLDERRQNRPSMKEVAEEIEYIITIVTENATKT